MLLAGCATAAAPNSVSAPATTAKFTHAQVLSWVTPTLQNGLSLVGLAPPGATAAQLSASSQPLRTAVSVSLHELREVSWQGPLKRPEATLVRDLTRLADLAASMPGSSYLPLLGEDAQRARSALRTLAQKVTS
jgi:hypothetical protein